VKNFSGYLQIYTGEGKGKTTSSVGLCLRALFRGLKIAFFQFFKPGDSGEIKALQKCFPQNFYYKNYFEKGFVKGEINSSLKKLIIEGWEEVKEVIKSQKFHIVVLDEFTYTLKWKILELNKVVEFLKNKPNNVEIIITGRDAPDELIKIADLVTEMKKIKHYFDKGIKAREGIEK
jgi:cob(I)alamin adenosyltransferase